MNDFVEIRYIIRVLHRRWWVLLVTVILAVLAGYSFTAQQTKIYRATTSLIVGPAIQDTALDRYSFEISQKLAWIYADIAQRQPVLQAVVDTLHLDQSWRSLRSQMQVGPVDATQLLEISIEATSPEKASAIADEVARQLILVGPTALGKSTDNEADQFVRQRMDRLQANIEVAQRRIDTAEESLSNADGVSVELLRLQQSEIETLETLIVTWESTYATLYASLQGEGSTDYLTVLEPAQTSSNPIRPLVKLYLLISTIIGVALGIGLMFLLDYADNTLHSAAEATEFLRLPSLGAISRIPGDSIENKLFDSKEMFSSIAEDFRLLRSKLLFLSKEWPHKVILVTSSAQGEGKSLVVANLGIAMANIGLKTVIVDANLRNPIQHVLFHLPQVDGLTEEIHSPQSQLTRRLKKSRIQDLYLLTSGNLSLASPDKFATARMTELFTMLANSADIILCDAPEADAVADTLVLADKVNGVLLVVDTGSTQRQNARQAVHNLQQTGANLLGVVLNRASAQARKPSSTSLSPPVTASSIVERQVPAK